MGALLPKGVTQCQVVREAHLTPKRRVQASEPLTVYAQRSHPVKSPCLPKTLTGSCWFP